MIKVVIGMGTYPKSGHVELLERTSYGAPHLLFFSLSVSFSLSLSLSLFLSLSPSFTLYFIVKYKRHMKYAYSFYIYAYLRINVCMKNYTVNNSTS